MLSTGAPGNITVNHDILAVGNLTLSAGNSIFGTGLFESSSLNLTVSNNGTAGTSSQPLTTRANLYTFHGGSTAIVNTTNTLQLHTLVATSSIQIQNSGSLTINGSITGKTIALNNTNGNIFVASNIGSATSNVTISEAGTNNVIVPQGGVITASNLTLSDNGGSIGSIIGTTAVPLLTASPNINFAASNQATFINIQNTGALTLGAVSASTSIGIAGSAAITNIGSVVAPAITLQAGLNSKITLNQAVGDPTTTNSISFVTSGSGSVVQGSGTYALNALGTVTYTGGTSGAFGTAAVPLRTDIGGFRTLGITANVGIFNTSTNTGLNAPAVQGSVAVSITSNGTLNVGDVVAPTVLLKDNDLNGGNLKVSSTAGGSGNTTISSSTGNIEGNGTLSGKVLVLNSGAGSIAGSLTVFANSISVATSASGTGSATLSLVPVVNSSVNLLASTLGGSLIVNSLAGLTLNVTGAISASSISISASSINVGSTVGTAISQTQLTASSGNISGTGLVSGANVLLSANEGSPASSLSGNVGSATAPLKISTPSTSLSSGTIDVSASNLVSINNTFTSKTAVLPVLLNSTGSGANAGTSFKYVGAYNLIANNVTASNGALTLSTAAVTTSVGTPIPQSFAGLTINSGAQIFASNGNVTINDTTIAGTAGGTIALGANSTIRANAATIGATAGNVIVAIGAAPSAATGTNAVQSLTNVTIHATGTGTGFGNVYLNATPSSVISATGSNTIFATNANVILSSGKSTQPTITFGGGVAITADPPSPSLSLAGAMTGSPNVPMTGSPNVPMTGSPNVPMTGSPNVPMTGSPNVPMTGSPNVPMTGSPNVPMTGSPYVPMTGSPISLLTAFPTVQMTTSPGCPASTSSRSELRLVQQCKNSENEDSQTRFYFVCRSSNRFHGDHQYFFSFLLALINQICLSTSGVSLAQFPAKLSRLAKG